MKVGEFRTYTDALARFATTREKAQGPEALIGVQVKDEILKLISGTSTAGMAVTIPNHKSESGDYSLVVSARPILQAAKVLPASTTIDIRAAQDGLHLEAEGGGSIDVSREMSLREAGFAKKPKTKRVVSEPLSPTELKRMARLFKAVSAKVEVPSVQVIAGIGYATAVSPGNRPTYCSFRFEANSSEGPEDEYSMSAYRNFWEALTHFTQDGVLSWGKAGVMLESGNMTAFSAPYLVSKYSPETGAEPPREAEAWPILVMTEKSDVKFTLARKTLIQIVKGQAPYDEHNRVTFEVDTDSLRVSPFGSKDGMDTPATTEGKGIRSVNADYLTALLNAMDSKEVTLRWSGGVPAISISAKDYGSWTILLAPVTI